MCYINMKLLLYYYQIGEKAQFLRKNGGQRQTKNVINVCMHKFACTNVTQK